MTEAEIKKQLSPYLEAAENGVSDEQLKQLTAFRQQLGNQASDNTSKQGKSKPESKLPWFPTAIAASVLLLLTFSFQPTDKDSIQQQQVNEFDSQAFAIWVEVDENPQDFQLFDELEFYEWVATTTESGI